MNLFELSSTVSETVKRMNPHLFADGPSQAKRRTLKQILVDEHTHTSPGKENASNHGKTPSPELEFALQGNVDQNQGEAGHPKRILVRVTSYRRKLLDPDNLCPKYFIDCLRYAGLIPDDTARDIEIATGQEKVRTPEEERTEIEITRF